MSQAPEKNGSNLLKRTDPADADSSGLLETALMQLGEIDSTTRESTRHVMQAIEDCLSLQMNFMKEMTELRKKTDPDDAQLIHLEETVQTFGDLLIDISTRLAFHDIIVQRISIAQKSLQGLHEVIKKGSPLPAVQPEQDGHTELKGPDKNASQGNVDNLLNSLGI